MEYHAALHGPSKMLHGIAWLCLMNHLKAKMNHLKAYEIKMNHLKARLNHLKVCDRTDAKMSHLKISSVLRR